MTNENQIIIIGALLVCSILGIAITPFFEYPKILERPINLTFNETLPIDRFLVEDNVLID